MTNLILKECNNCLRVLVTQCFYNRGPHLLRATCKKCDIVRVREYGLDKTESKRLYDKKYRADNVDKIRKAGREYSAINSASAVSRVATWRKYNPEARRVQENKRRSLKSGVGCDLTTREWKEVLSSWGNKCANPECMTSERISLDHKQSLSMGGKHTKSNVQPLCVSCNSSKNSKSYSFLRNH